MGILFYALTAMNVAAICLLLLHAVHFMRNRLSKTPCPKLMALPRVHVAPRKKISSVSSCTGYALAVAKKGGMPSDMEIHDAMCKTWEVRDGRKPTGSSFGVSLYRLAPLYAMELDARFRISKSSRFPENCILLLSSAGGCPEEYRSDHVAACLDGTIYDNIGADEYERCRYRVEGYWKLPSRTSPPSSGLPWNPWRTLRSCFPCRRPSA